MNQSKMREKFQNSIEDLAADAVTVKDISKKESPINCWVGFQEG